MILGMADYEDAAMVDMDKRAKQKPAWFRHISGLFVSFMSAYASIW